MRSKLLSLLMTGALLMPSLAIAEDSNQGGTEGTNRPTLLQPRSSSPEPTRSPKVEGAQFCARFTDATGDVSGQTSTKFTELQSDFNGRAGKVDDDFNSVNQKLATSRKSGDDRLQENFDKLNAKATTDDQKAAVATFEAAVKDAVTKRRAAVDAANTAFHTAVLGAVSARQNALKTAAAAYKSTVAAAIAAAKASCAAGTPAATVRATLAAKLAAAKSALETARQTADKVGPDLTAAKAARKAAVDKANADFKAAIQAALTALKAALGTTTSTPTPTPDN